MKPMYKTKIGVTKVGIKLIISKREKDKLGDWDQQIHSAIYMIGNQQGPAVYHRKLCQYSVVAYVGKHFTKSRHTHMHA